MTFIAVVVLAAFLSPLVRSFSLSIKSPEQVAQVDGPLYPASPAKFTYKGRPYDVYQVPLPSGTTRNLALVRKGRTSSEFVDPTNEAAGLVTWEGQWRTLSPAWTFDPQWHNYSDVWDQINYPRLLFNTVAIALIGMVGTIISCTLVAYGFARFRFPGRDLLFILVIATIFLPGAVTIIPTYAVFAKIGWVGTWLPLLVPTFFANAYDVFLLRQYLLTIPREMDEAAAIDGAGPFRTLISVIIPQAWPAIIAVSIFHLVYAWNDFFAPAHLPLDQARPPDAGSRARPLQHAALPQPGLHPGRNPPDDDHPDRDLPGLPAVLHPRHRDQRGREVAGTLDR